MYNKFTGVEPIAIFYESTQIALDDRSHLVQEKNILDDRSHSVQESMVPTEMMCLYCCFFQGF